MKFWTLITLGLAMTLWSGLHEYLAWVNVVLLAICVCVRAHEQRWPERMELRFHERELRRVNRRLAKLRTIKSPDWADKIAILEAAKEQTQIGGYIANLRFRLFGQLAGLDYHLDFEL